MKQYAVDMDVTVSLTINVDADSEDQARQLAMEKFDREQMFHLSHCDSVLERQVTGVNECASESELPEKPAVKVPYKEAYEKIQYFFVENTKEKTTSEVMDEIRKFIRSLGWECLDDAWDYEEAAREWLEEHPEFKKLPCEHYAGPDLEFLCNNDCGGSHDVDWYDFRVCFYGFLGVSGVFYVEHV